MGGCHCWRRCPRWRERSPHRPARSCWRSPSAGAACCSAECLGVAAANVLVIGGGVVGFNAASIAIGMEADVFMFDRNVDRLRELDVAFGGRASTVYASTLAIEEMLPMADLVIGAVLVHGARAPYVISRGAAEADEAPSGAGGRVDRSGRLLRDLPTHDPLRSHLRGRRHHPLLRGEHAGRCADHLHVRAHQRDAALRASRSPTTACARRSRRTLGLRPGVNVAGGKVTHAAVAEGTGRGVRAVG